MLLPLFLNILLPLAFTAVRAYIQSPSTKQDGKLLDVIQESCEYLAQNRTTTLNPSVANQVSKQIYIGESK